MTLDELGDLITALGEAEPDHKLEVYGGLGLRLTYRCTVPNQCIYAELPFCLQP